jgi:hypothetical protein
MQDAGLLPEGRKSNPDTASDQRRGTRAQAWFLLKDEISYDETEAANCWTDVASARPKYNEHSASRYKDTSSNVAHGSSACLRWLSSGENGCSIR